MWELLDYDEMRQAVPFYIYKRLTTPSELTSAAQDVLFLETIPRGFIYLLREMHYRTAFADRDIDPTYDLAVEFIQPLRSRALQKVSYPARLISTPGTTQGSTPTIQIAGILQNNIILNYVYYREDTITLRFSWKRSGKKDSFYIETLLTGYFIPDKILNQWG